MINLKTFKDERGWKYYCIIMLLTIHPNPGPERRNKTLEGKAARLERKYIRRRDKRPQVKTVKTMKNKLLKVMTWNVKKMPLGTANRRKAQSVLDIASKNNWNVLLLSEVRGRDNGVKYLEDCNREQAVTIYS